MLAPRPLSAHAFTGFLYPMKIALLCLALPSLFLGSGCVCQLAYAPPPSAPAERPIADVAPDLHIVSAVYGSGTAYADVTERVCLLLQLESEGFHANPGDLRRDPTPGWNKALVITYDYKGRRHIFTRG